MEPTQAVVSAIQTAQARQAAQPNAPVAARVNGNGANGNGVVA